MSPCSLRMHLLWISPCVPDHLDVCQRFVSWIIKTMFSLRVIDTWLHGVAWLAMRRTIEIRLGSWSMIHPHAVDFGRKEWQMIPFDFVSRSDCLRSPPLESNKVLTSEEWRTRVIQHNFKCRCFGTFQLLDVHRNNSWLCITWIALAACDIRWAACTPWLLSVLSVLCYLVLSFVSFICRCWMTQRLESGDANCKGLSLFWGVIALKRGSIEICTSK